MPLDRRELAERIASTGPNDLVRGTVFHAVVNAVAAICPDHPSFARLETRFGPQAMQAHHFYPVSDWLVALWDACETLEPELGSLERAVDHLGRTACRTFLESVAGKLTAEAAAGKPPIDRLQHAPAAYGAASSFGRRSVERIDERRARMRFSREFVPPAFHVAMVRAGLAETGANVVLTVRPLGLLEFELEVEWLAEGPHSV
jgi:uncharacterized protein (TIGR02265 family)